MKRLHVTVETLRCEAPAHEIRDDLLAQAGVKDAHVLLEEDRVEVAYDERVTGPLKLLPRLGFYGLQPATEIAGAP